MEKRNLLLLLSLNKENAAFAQATLEAVKRLIDPSASAAWIDSRGAGIFISSDLPAAKVWGLAIPDLKTDADRYSFRDALLLELGQHHMGHPQAKAMAWLNSHATAAPPKE